MGLKNWFQEKVRENYMSALESFGDVSQPAQQDRVIGAVFNLLRRYIDDPVAQDRIFETLRNMHDKQEYSTNMFRLSCKLTAQLAQADFDPAFDPGLKNEIVLKSQRLMFDLSKLAATPGNQEGVVRDLMQYSDFILREENVPVTMSGAVPAVQIINQLTDKDYSDNFIGFGAAMAAQYIHGRPEWKDVDADIRNLAESAEYAHMRKEREFLKEARGQHQHAGAKISPQLN